MAWEPNRYLAYADQRGRPFFDLLARIGAAAPATVVDLGCGPGNLTMTLEERWPQARISGVDSSPEMIAAARAIEGIDWSIGDVREWRPSRPVDVLISNATLQWVPEHLALLADLVDTLAPGGWLGIQVPGNFGEASHTIRDELAAPPPYAEHLAGLVHPASHEPETYLDVLTTLGCQVEVWETTYFHVLTGPDPVFSWVSSTGARPTLETLAAVGLRAAFEAEFKVALAQAYPEGEHGVTLPFRRIFMVAQKPRTGVVQ